MTSTHRNRNSPNPVSVQPPPLFLRVTDRLELRPRELFNFDIRPLNTLQQPQINTHKSSQVLRHHLLLLAPALLCRMARVDAVEKLNGHMHATRPTEVMRVVLAPKPIGGKPVAARDGELCLLGEEADAAGLRGRQYVLAHRTYHSRKRHKKGSENHTHPTTYTTVTFRHAPRRRVACLFGQGEASQRQRDGLAVAAAGVELTLRGVSFAVAAAVAAGCGELAGEGLLRDGLVGRWNGGAFESV